MVCIQTHRDESCYLWDKSVVHRTAQLFAGPIATGFWTDFVAVPVYSNRSSPGPEAQQVLVVKALPHELLTS
jgi:hypothetical protein